MVGTHLPDNRDRFQSALQRMREAFDGLRGGDLSAEDAEREVWAAYAEAGDLAAGWPTTPLSGASR
jgi:hypothetical protein